MSLFRPLGNKATEINSIYRITMDVAGWDKVIVHTVAPMAGAIYVYGSLDGGQPPSQMAGGDDSTATNFQPIIATNLATGDQANFISAAGTYSVPVNNQFMRFQGSPAAAGMSVYKLFLANSKTS